VEALIDYSCDTALASRARKDELGFSKRQARAERLTHKKTTSDNADRSKPYPAILAATLALIPEVCPREVSLLSAIAI
jgi:hypothetical protein